jgi:hypothetical protein
MVDIQFKVLFSLKRLALGFFEEASGASRPGQVSYRLLKIACALVYFLVVKHTAGESCIYLVGPRVTTLNNSLVQMTYLRDCLANHFARVRVLQDIAVLATFQA